MGIIGFLSQLSLRLFSHNDETLYLGPNGSSRTHADSSPSMSAMRMPTEIVIHILNLASDASDSKQTRALLTSCALVCRDWSFIAQERLFSNVTLASDAAFRSFEFALFPSSPRSRNLANAVQRVHCVLDDKQPGGLSQSSLVRAVTLCPNLRTLSIALYGISIPASSREQGATYARSTKTSNAFHESTLALLRGVCQRITTLHFDNWSDDATALSQLLRTMGHITSLSIGGKAPSTPSHTESVYACSLQDLRLNFQTSPSHQFLEWLLSNSKETLRSLEFQREPSPTLLEYLVKEHHPTLQTLALPACASAEGAVLLTQCRALRELRLENAWSAPGVRRELPCTLQRLALAVDKDTPLKPVVQAIKRSGALAAVTIQLWVDGERNPQLPALKIACAVRGIKLEIMKDIRVFRTINRGYAFPGLTFSCLQSKKSA